MSIRAMTVTMMMWTLERKTIIQDQLSVCAQGAAPTTTIVITRDDYWTKMTYVPPNIMATFSYPKKSGNNQAPKLLEDAVLVLVLVLY